MATEIQLVVTATSNIDKKMNEAEKSIKKMEQQTEESTKNMESKFKGFGNVIQGVMGSVALKMGANLLKKAEATSLGLEILKTKSADVAAQLEKTQEATFGLANKFDMVTAANKALAFGIDLSNGKMLSLMKLSTKLAMVMGITTRQAFDDLITSSARQQKLIADNLGIMINKIKVEEKYADQLGITREQLTSQQQSQAFLNEIIIKGTEVTGKLGDEMIKSATKSTQAIKKVETFSTAVLNKAAAAFDWLGTKIGESFATAEVMHNKSLTNMWKQYIEYQREYDGSHKLSEKEFEKYYKYKYKVSKEYLEKIKKDYKSYIKYTSDSDKQSFENFKKQQIAKYDLILEANKEEEKIILAHKKNMKKIEDEEANSVADLIQIGGRWVPKTQLAKFKKIEDSIIKHKEKQSINIEKKEKEANKNYIKQKKDVINDIITMDKKLFGYDKAGFVEKLKLDKEYKIQKIQLNKKTLAELKKDRLGNATLIDEVNQNNKEIENDKKRKQALLDSEREFNNAVLEIAKQNAKQKKIISIQEYKAKKAAKEKEKALSEKHFGLLKQYGSEYLTAIIEGNASAIPKILAQQAMMFGQQIFWDGLKTLWFGTSQNSMFPGWGTSATAVGVSEMAVGTGLMAAGGIASNALNSAPSADSGSKERNRDVNKQDEINLKVTSSLYGSKTEAKRAINGLMQ